MNEGKFAGKSQKFIHLHDVKRELGLLLLLKKKTPFTPIIFTIYYNVPNYLFVV